MVKIVCQVCGVSGYLQHIGKNYYRVRHYLGYKDGKPIFKYHRQEPSYIHKLVGEQMGHAGQGVRTTGVDQNLKDSGFKLLERRAGSSAWNECLTCTQEAVGSNPARST
jgi:hypothetical protein